MDDLASGVAVPMQVRIELAHGVVQLLCERHLVDALHIKGMALDPALRFDGRLGSDLDLLVRPRDVERLGRVLGAHGWRRRGEFASGSAFGHAQNWRHDSLGHLDLHRLIPGVGLDPAAAFGLLWARRRTTRLAGVACAVPATDGQALVLLLHAARSHADSRSVLDVEQAWTEATPVGRQRILALTTALRAQVALAAATGDLERYRGHRDYLLWRANSTPGDERVTEWAARIRSARGVRAKAGLVLGSVLVNRDHLRELHDREPTRGELARAFVDRPLRAARELRGRLPVPGRGAR